MNRPPTSNHAAYWINKLRLEPHPEGGYYHQTYRSDLILSQDALGGEFTGPRAVATSIYFLLLESNFSAFHRLRSDELWHFHLGAPVLVHVIEPDGRYSRIQLGSDPERGETFQAVVKAGCWFASEITSRDVAETTSKNESDASFSLVGCTVSPGFDFDDFELAERENLVKLYPQHRDVIVRLTRER